jgi:hypothetical protein
LQLGAREVTARPLNTSTCAAVAPGRPPRRRAARGRWVALASALCLSGCLAACGSGSSPSAGTLLRQTFSSHASISSGQVDLLLALWPHPGAGAARGPFSLHIAGPFQSAGAGRFPQFALALTRAAGRRSVGAGAVSTGGRLYLELGGRTFLAPAATISALEQGYRQASSTGTAAAGGQSLAALGLEPRGWLTKPSVAGRANVDGAETIHIVAGLDASRFLADAARLQAPAEALTGAGGAGLLTPARAAALSRSLRSGRVDLYTGAKDHLLRRLALRAEVLVPAAERAAPGQLPDGMLTFTLRFARLNSPQTIAAPRTLQPLSQLAGALEGVGTAPALPAR